MRVKTDKAIPLRFANSSKLKPRSFLKARIRSPMVKNLSLFGHDPFCGNDTTLEVLKTGPEEPSPPPRLL